jgi:Epoxide hydrolase N terminus
VRRPSTIEESTDDREVGMATVETATEIRPFHADIPAETLEDLRRRIDATRWPSKELVEDRSQGVQLATLQELARYWTTDYDFGRIEARLNALPQFTTEIDGVDIHFIRVRSPHENALPLIITHGWPGSVIELLDTIGPLTDPTAHGGSAEDAFHLVLPSLPGYGFSGEPTELGWETARTGRAWAELMHRLGYTRYVAQGGDVGALVTDAIGRQAPDGLVAIHLNLLTAALAIADQLPAESEKERAALAALGTFRATGFGYYLEQATRPQTIGYALLDSPIALAAWMLDHDTDSYYKISRAFVDGGPHGQPHARQHPRQHHAVLAHGHRRLGCTGVLGERTSASSRGRPSPSSGYGAGRLHHLPRRGRPRPAQLGGDRLPDSHLLQRGRPGWPLRRLGGARALHERGPGGIQVTALEARTNAENTEVRHEHIDSAGTGNQADGSAGARLEHSRTHGHPEPGRARPGGAGGSAQAPR